MLSGPLLRWDYVFLVAVLKKKMLQNAVALFDSLTGKTIQCRPGDATVLYTFYTDFFYVFLINSYICSVSYFVSLSFHTWTVRGGHVDSCPRLGLGTSFGRCCTLYFFPWSKPWLCMGTEPGRLQSGNHAAESPVRPSVNDFEWMPASSSTGSFESLSLFSRFLVIDWLFVFVGGTGTVFPRFLLRLGIGGRGIILQCLRHKSMIAVCWTINRRHGWCTVMPHTVCEVTFTRCHITPVCSDCLRCKRVVNPPHNSLWKHLEEQWCNMQSFYEQTQTFYASIWSTLPSRSQPNVSQCDVIVVLLSFRKHVA